VILLLAVRTLAARPIRSAVLAVGFGLGVAVMAILLGVGQVVLEQARSPQLAGGGDVLVTGTAGRIAAARVLLGGTLETNAMAARVRVASPWTRATLYLGSQAVRTRAGVPSLERALGDPEIAGQEGWRDTEADRRWTEPDPGSLLRSIDRFHPIPDVPDRAASWAEWLYFNGRTEDGTRFYLTFLVGPRTGHSRPGGVRLQLDRGHGVESFAASAALTDADVASAPDLAIAGNRVRLDGLQYRITLDVVDRRGRRVGGEIAIAASVDTLLAPIEIHGARGWRSGYVVPVMRGALTGTLIVAGQRLELRGTGYHDHNWGFWEGVSWQWGQVQHGDTAFVYGRLFPPADAADSERMPGFLGAIGPEGPLGFATNVSIRETNRADGTPATIDIRGRTATVDLTLRFDVSSTVVNRMEGGPLATRMQFLQMRGRYAVSGEVAGRRIDFEAPGSAETFRGK
jgi:hypothetical protein